MNRFASRVKSLVQPIVLVLIFVGCGGTPIDGFKGERGQVSGKITLGGEPVQAGCQVMFMSTGKGGYVGTGVIAEGGTYTLTYKVGEGLPAVDYLVQLAPPAGSAPKAAMDPMTMGASLKTDKTKEVDEGKPFPLMYASTATSKLQFKVKAGKNTADFDLVPIKK